MTIASEITRLQGAKADIRQAIIDKGVDVCADLTIDEYACCIAEISGGIEGYYISYLAVGGGGGGSLSGGGGGEVKVGCEIVFDNSYSIVVGGKGSGVNSGRTGGNGGMSCIGSIICAKGGCGGTPSKGGASGGGFTGGNCACLGGGGGAGATANGGYASCKVGGKGGAGLCGYGGGGGGYVYNGGGQACDGGGKGDYSQGGNATNCGGGGGGAATGGSGACGVVDICYRCDGKYGFSCATGGTKSSITVDGVEYCVHRFTSNGTFTIVS